MEIVFNKVSYVINRRTPLEKTILNDVSFSITEPGIYSFVGASNSGKTAIGDLINSLCSPTKGSVKIGKYKIDGDNTRNLKSLRFETGYVYKNPYDMFFNKTVSEEISFAMHQFDYKTKKGDLRVIDALKLVGLDENYLDIDPMDLNVRDAKKVALACILIYNPKVIILDEFTNGLTSEDKSDLVRLLKTLKNKYRKIIILLSKDTTFCYQISDYIYLMSYTRLVKEGKRSILEDEELLSEINLPVPHIASFVNLCNKKGHEINHYTNILDLIKEVYRDVF